jgi:hypothetical protein
VAAAPDDELGGADVVMAGAVERSAEVTRFVVVKTMGKVAGAVEVIGSSVGAAEVKEAAVGAAEVSEAEVIEAVAVISANAVDDD